jgi:hypothetical protein
LDRYARYTWTLMRDFMRAGASAYMYWNIATPQGGASTWGWRQNDMSEPQPLRIAVGTGKLVSVTLPADSFNTLVT